MLSQDSLQKLVETVHIRYQNQIDKQLPKGLDYKPRMGLIKGKDFFFKVDDEYNKEKRLEMLRRAQGAKNIINYIDEEKDNICKALSLLSPAIINSVDNDSDPVVEAFHAMAKYSDADILILNTEAKIVGYAICFPTGWEPAGKLGQSVAEAHSVVPDMTNSLNSSISSFLNKLEPDKLYQRANIGFLGEDKLDCRPDNNIKKIKEYSTLEDIWVRIEHQGITKLMNGYIAFGIKVENVPLKFFIQNTNNKAGVLKMLTTLSEPMAMYKGIPGAIRTRIVNLIEREICGL